MTAITVTLDRMQAKELSSLLYHSTRAHDVLAATLAAAASETAMWVTVTVDVTEIKDDDHAQV